MAAISKWGSLAGIFGKRFPNRIHAGRSQHHPDPLLFFPASVSRRAAHVSSYDKEVDDQVRPTVVPDDVIQSGSDGRYWAPHPQTGVFGPAAEQSGTGSGGGDHGVRSPPPDASGNGSTVLDQTVWFRPVEGVDNPPHL